MPMNAKSIILYAALMVATVGCRDQTPATPSSSPVTSTAPHANKPAVDQPTSWVWKKSEPGTPVILEAKLSEAEGTLFFEHGLSDVRVSALVELEDGTLAIGTSEGLVFWKNGQSSIYTVQKNKRLQGLNGLLCGSINDLLVTNNGDLWVAGWNGVARLKKGRWEHIHRNRSPLIRALNFHTLFETSTGTVVVGSTYAGVFSFDIDQRKVSELHKMDVYNMVVKAIDEDSKGQLWVAAMGLGVLRIKGKAIKTFTDKEEWIPSIEVSDIFIDSTDQIWVATFGAGLGHRSASGESTVYTEKDVLPDDSVYTLITLKNGAKLVQTYRGLVKFDNGQWRYLQDDSSRSLAYLESKTGDTWKAERAKIFKNPTLMWSEVQPAFKVIKAYKEKVESVYPDIAGLRHTAIDNKTVWGSIKSRLLTYDGEKWLDKSELLKDKEIAFIRNDSSGRVWIGTQGAGLIGIDNAAVTIRNQTKTTKSVIYEFIELSKETIIFGTQGGLFRLSGDEWERIKLSGKEWGRVEPSHRLFQPSSLTLDAGYG